MSKTMGRAATKKILYGDSNFASLMTDNGYYVDKTKFIEQIENLGARYLLFLRPRRFGKSLFLSTLEYYYDINQTEQFDKLFGGLYIGKNPTPLKNSLPILKLNFSAVITHGGIEAIEHSFNLTVLLAIEKFYADYAQIITSGSSFTQDIKPLEKASDMLKNLVSKMNLQNASFYLLIDEYDNFANNVLADHGKDRYQNLTHGTGFLRNFFTVIKAGTDSKTIARMFATGVSPLLMSDVTSGFNIGANISQDLMFSEMVGFTQQEVETAVDYYIEHRAVPAQDRERVLSVMKNNYDGYMFSPEASQSIYNSNSVLYLLNQYTMSGKMPREVIDSNMMTDYRKLRFLVVESEKLNGNFNLLAQILQSNGIVSDLVTSFAATDLIKQDRFISFLYYLGFLSIKEQLLSRLVFTIPNDMCKTLLWGYLRESLTSLFPLNTMELSNLLIQMALKGDWKPAFRHIFDKFYQAVSNRDFVFREEGVKVFLLAYLNLAGSYRVHSEREFNQGHADIYIEPRLDVYPQMCPQHFLIELKYIKKDDLKPKARKKTIDSLLKQATAQLERYAQDSKLPANTVKIVALTTNDELLVLQPVT